MRIHTNSITRGRMAECIYVNDKLEDVYFGRLDDKGSRIRDHAFDVKLEAWEGSDINGTKRRRVNSGFAGAGTYIAATWDEWGFFLARVFELDPEALCGSKSYPVYDGADDFHAKTDNKFRR